jgi:hypothetical protein
MPSVVIPEWNASRVYRPNEVVFYSGLLYVALYSHANKAPTDTDYWTTLAASGSVPDASTTVKGKASFAAADFDVTSGAVSLDYTNGPQRALTLTQSSPVRALDTTYINDSATHARLVVASAWCEATTPGTDTAYIQAVQDTSNPPTTAVTGKMGTEPGSTNGAGNFTVVFFVPPGVTQRYRINKTTANGTVTLGTWVEIVL